jgi:hypothetical protein
MFFGSPEVWNYPESKPFPEYGQHRQLPGSSGINFQQPANPGNLENPVNFGNFFPFSPIDYSSSFPRSESDQLFVTLKVFFAF